MKNAGANIYVSRVVVAAFLAAPFLFAGSARAQTTVNPVQTTTFTLDPAQNSIVFGAGTNIDTTATVGTTAVFGGSGATWTVANQGNLSGAAIGVELIRIGSSLTNSGTISGVSTIGVQLSNGGTIVNQQSGNIIGGIDGIQATSATVTNAGTVTAGSNGIGVQLIGANNVVTNTGTISGGVGIEIDAPGGTVTNSGTISGSGGAGGQSVSFGGSGTNTLTLKTGSRLDGTAFGSTATGATNNLILQGSGIANNDFVFFNSLTLSSASWTLNGQSFVGTATIDKLGNFTVGDQNHPGAVLTGDVTVSGSASLEGLGKIVGNINVTGGVLRPGIRTGDGNTSAGTMNVTGNVVFAPGSNFIASTTPTAASKLAVVGTATLGGATVLVHAGGTNYAPSTKYTILTATGTLGVSPGVIGTFGKVVDSLPFLTPSLTYDANDVFLTLDVIGAQPGAPGGGFANAAQTRNQRDVAGALDAGVAAVNPVTNPMLLALLNLTSAADARQAFDALSGEVVGSVQSAQMGQMQFARTAMLGRMRQASYYGAPGELGALSFGGPELAYAGGDAGANAMPVRWPLFPARRRHGLSVPRAISPSGRRVSAAGVMPTAMAMPPR